MRRLLYNQEGEVGGRMPLTQALEGETKAMHSRCKGLICL